MNAEPLTLCLLVSAEDQPLRSFPSEPRHVRRAAIMRLDPDGTPRNLSAGSCSRFQASAAYADLAAQADTHVYSASPPEWLTYWRLRFEPTLGAELSELEPVIVTMRRVSRQLDKLTERYGPPATFGQYVARLADALRITTALRTITATGWLPDSEYATMTPADAGAWLDRAEDTFRAAHPIPPKVGAS